MSPQLSKSPKDYVVPKIFMNKTGPDLPGYANFTTSPDLPAAIQREFPSCINFALILGLRDKIPKRISV